MLGADILRGHPLGAIYNATRCSVTECAARCQKLMPISLGC